MIDTNVLRENWPHLAAYADEIDRLGGELSKAIAWLDQCSWEDAKIDLNKGPLEAQLANAKADLKARTDVYDENDRLKSDLESLVAAGQAESERLKAEAFNPETGHPWKDDVAALREERDRAEAKRPPNCDECGQSFEFRGFDSWEVAESCDVCALRKELATARALAMEEAGSWCERHAGDATLDRTGVERKTLLFLATRLPELAPLPPTLVAVPRELIESAIREYRLGDADERANWQAPEDDEVRRLCERIGYGAVMDAAARRWRGLSPTGAFLVGSCVGLVRPIVTALAALLDKPNGEKCQS